MNKIQSLSQFAIVLTSLLADKPQGTVGRLPTGGHVWILDGQVIYCWEGAEIDFAFPWDQSALDAATIEEVNDWLKNPTFECHIPDEEFEGDLSLSPFQE
ncbi:hypothetical protein HA052_04355 [Chromobacterium haemolyticum]|uniref:Uncharacterized protein n=1 Tax=Chromobacterium fluminis TaxID=3044269 RepID=A0ABX0L455_9NEIS|nr:hypothetical protein [Chromobacterium haemolyticum]NHR04422.1 hypothetical protein [Chromobacterium haemolyticum]